ncbi:hypothetical protein MCC10108_1770 [Bifidobacterium longum subsp. longum]|nr:hypothetical protein MCC10108_1770 [Bifidobacterium longum subsp. longum]
MLPGQQTIGLQPPVHQMRVRVDLRPVPAIRLRLGRAILHIRVLRDRPAIHVKTPRYLRARQPLPVESPDILHNGHRYRHDPFLPEHRPAATGRIQFELQLGNIQAAAPMPLTSPGNDDDTGENHQPTLRKNTAEPVEQTLKQNSQAGWIKPPLVDRPVDRGRKDHQSRPFDRDPARDPPGRPMLPHDKTPHKPRPSLAVEDPGPHAGNPSGLAATLGGRCTMAPPRANGERVSGHLLADGRFVSARRSGHPAAAPRASATRFPRARPRQGGRTGPWDLPIPGCRKQTPSYREPMGPHHPQALHQQ